MSDEFAQELDRLLHAARYELDRIEYTRRHCEAVTDGINQLAQALDHLDTARHGLLVRVAGMIGQPMPADDDRLARLGASFAGEVAE